MIALLLFAAQVGTSQHVDCVSWQREAPCMRMSWYEECRDRRGKVVRCDQVAWKPYCQWKRVSCIRFGLPADPLGLEPDEVPAYATLLRMVLSGNRR